MLFITVSSAYAGFHFVSEGCSWYEKHMLGGCQRPAPHPDCLAAPMKHKQRLAVLIVYRGIGNAQSFGPLCARLPAHLEEQGTDFHLLAINQVDLHPFNRAALANVAFTVLTTGGRPAGLRASDRRPFDCLAIHDVDRFPVAAASNHSCAPLTASYYSCAQAAPQVLHPSSYTGGVLLLRPSLLRAVNGFSNQFWGWGHEDNELYLRLRRCGLPPRQPVGLSWCMEHHDCEQCRRAKPAGDSSGLRAETRNIALLYERMGGSAIFTADDGLSTVNFSSTGRPRRIACGRHVLHLLDVRLHRPPNRRSTPCVADDTASDDGCIAPLSPNLLSHDLLERAKGGLPPGARTRRVLHATRERVMYNFHYELDLETDEVRRGRTVYRIAICAQPWQQPHAPLNIRYQLLWRAIAKPPTAGSGGRGDASKARGFRLSKDFGYGGHFPCALREPPWVLHRQGQRTASRLVTRKGSGDSSEN